MSIARHHAEWLSLVPVSGPFLSLPVLLEEFPQGLEPHDADLSRLVRQEYENWEDSLEKHKGDPVPHQQWIKFVLTQVLELDDRVLAEGQAIPQTLQVEVPEHHELLRPNIVVIDPNTKKPRLLVQTYPRTQELSSYVAGSRWKASPDTRMTELLHATGVRLGLLTNGEQWILVDAPKGETTGYSSWYASLWLEEKITLQAFRSLLSASRFFNVPDDQTLEALFTKSASNQQEITDQLGYQVRRAVEVLIHSLDRADQDNNRALLADVKEEVLYESALTVMMRLVFLFCAEERELIPSKPFPVYEQNYSVSMISKQLRELADQHGEELLERRFDAWSRLLSAFRAVYGGLQHDDVHIPAYGGSLFNPDRFPFLEGRKPGTSWRDTEAAPLPVNNRTVLHLLEALQLLQVKIPGGGPAEARRLSFRALDIEQIGHVYEGLLDHTAKRAIEPFLGLAGTRAKEPEIPLAELEKVAAKGEADFIKYLREETGKSEKALVKAIHAEIDPLDAARFRTACQSDDSLWQRVKSFAGLVRLDNFGYPVVIPKGSVFVTAGTDRRSSGTHYTPRSLTEPIVQYTMEPLVFVGPAEGLPKNEWKLKSAKQLLELKICDMACGSGAFLVQAARYMAERLMEAWDVSKEENPTSPGITPDGSPSTGKADELLIPDDPAERKTYAMRLIAQRCLYGVDKNPLAAEMAKLSLWLLTLAKDKPFEFLDHSIRCGDSLVGLHDINQLRHFSLKPEDDDAVLFRGPLDRAVDDAIDLRLKLEDMPSNTVEDVERQERLLKEANDKIARLRCAADLLVSAEFWGESPKDKLARLDHAAIQSGHYVERGPTEEFEQVAASDRRGQSMFHWPLEFPEVMIKRGGFDAFVGNPPFVGGGRISTLLGDAYLSFLLSRFPEAYRSVDLSAYFILQADLLEEKAGRGGFIATNTLSEGDTRKACLDSLLSRGRMINRVIRCKWPGSAAVEVVLLMLARNASQLACVLNGSIVPAISSDLSEFALATPHRLFCNQGLCFEGLKVHGKGFILTLEEASALVMKSPNETNVIKPFLGGTDLTSTPDCSASRFIINFSGMEREEAEKYKLAFQIVLERVKPHRDTIKSSYHGKRFWRYWTERPELSQQLSCLRQAIAASRVGKFLSFVYVNTQNVLSDSLVIFPSEDRALFGFLQSSLHAEWAYSQGSTLRSAENGFRYTYSTCFETIPLFDFSMAFEVREGAERYYAFRQAYMTSQQCGVTDVYNRFHDPDKTSSEIQTLREMHVDMDQAVAVAYGWSDLDLDHGFQQTKQGIRFTISEPARREVLQRLLKLNHERYAEEVKQGLHNKKKGADKKAPPPRKQASGKARKPKPTSSTPSLFDESDDELIAHVVDVDQDKGLDSPSRPRRSGASNSTAIETVSRTVPIEEIEKDDVMAAIRRATRGRGSMTRDELLKEVSIILGYQRLGPKIEEALRGHLRAAIRRHIIAADGPDLVRAETTSMANYHREELRETFISVMRKGNNYEREDVIHLVSRYLGFARTTDVSREAIKSAINSAIRQGILGYEGSVIWRED